MNLVNKQTVVDIVKDWALKVPEPESPNDPSYEAMKKIKDLLMIDFRTRVEIEFQCLNESARAKLLKIVDEACDKSYQDGFTDGRGF